VRVLAGVLSAGEPNLRRTFAGIHSQTGVCLELVHISNLPKAEAHRQLYTEFSARTADFDVLVKVDGDMEIIHPRLFLAICAVFTHFSHIDRVSVSVDDWLSKGKLGGLNSWRGGVRWLENPPDLFSDRVRNTSGSSVNLLGGDEPLVLHAVRPSPVQVLRYGAHRALKAVAKAASPRRSLSGLRQIEDLIETCRTDPVFERRLLLLAIGESLHDNTFGRVLIDALPPEEIVEAAVARAWAIPPETLVSIAKAQVTHSFSRYIAAPNDPELARESEKPHPRFPTGKAIAKFLAGIRRPTVRPVLPRTPPPEEVFQRALSQD